MAHEEHFNHLALFYSGLDEYIHETSAFLREGIESDEHALVVIAPEKTAMLREELGAGAAHVVFADMNEVGRNPARIIPAWQAFLDDNLPHGRRIRGIGEPIWAARTDAELVECERHEALLNVAFAGSGDWSLLCPYDTQLLADGVLDEARRNHPLLVEGGVRRASDVCRSLDEIAQPFDITLPRAPRHAHTFDLDETNLEGLRRFLMEHATREGLAGRSSSLVLAVHELATNSLRHGGGRADVRVWGTPSAVLAEVSDGGRIEDPLVGRIKPADTNEGGWGVWIANQVCDLVQVRTFATGSIVRVHVTKPGPVIVVRTSWGEVHLDERQLDHVSENLWSLGVQVAGAAMVATKLTQARRGDRRAIELDERESRALETAL